MNKKKCTRYALIFYKKNIQVFKMFYVLLCIFIYYVCMQRFYTTCVYHTFMHLRIAPQLMCQLYA